MENPFLAPICGFDPIDRSLTLPEDKPQHLDCDEKGNAFLYKMENGVQVITQQLGSIRNFGQRKLHKVLLMTREELETEPSNDTTVLELAARSLAINAASGDKQSITEIFDRTLGKPKQITENYSVVRTIDDVLNEVFDENDRPLDPVDITSTLGDANE